MAGLPGGVRARQYARMELEQLVAPLREDVQGGAAEVAIRAIAAFEAVLDEAQSVGELRDDLERLALELVQAQPAMAPLLRLSAAVLDAQGAENELAPARALTHQALDRFRRHLLGAPAEIAARAEVLIPAGGSVLTVSSSSTVRAALLEAAARRAFSIVCTESRPNEEGRDLARSLAEAGLTVTFAVDAAITSLIRRCDVVLVGADSIGDLGIVNKIGTRLAALAARGAGIPVYALCDSTKLLPPGVAQTFEEDRAASEVWPNAPQGVRVWNRYYEATPLAFFEGIVTEAGLQRPQEIEAARERIRMPHLLLRRTAATK